jgi:hypothetical protein
MAILEPNNEILTNKNMQDEIKNESDIIINFKNFLNINLCCENFMNDDSLNLDQKYSKLQNEFNILYGIENILIELRSYLLIHLGKLHTNPINNNNNNSNNNNNNKEIFLLKLEAIKNHNNVDVISQLINLIEENFILDFDVSLSNQEQYANIKKELVNLIQIDAIVSNTRTSYIKYLSNINSSFSLSL